MSDNLQWYALRESGRNAGGQYIRDRAYSLDIEKLKAYAADRVGKPLEWTADNHARGGDWFGFDIVPDDTIVILL